jgi:Mg2+/citrate symporter
MLCLVINLACALYIIKIHVNMALIINYREAVGKKKNIGKNLLRVCLHKKIGEKI